MASMKGLSSLQSMVKKGTSNIDMDALKNKAQHVGDTLMDKAVDIKGSALSTKEDIENKLNELDCMLKQSITEYNDAYTLMNDKGIKLFVERSRAMDSVEFVESLINSIANKPKSFDADFEEIETNRKQFTDACDFADRELQAARVAAGTAGAGLAAGASVAFMAPTAAMWIATTFGTASTGTAISTLSGAAATKAALAWIGGGALSVGGGGIAAGKAFLAMAGPVGWGIAGATLLSSIILFSTKRAKLNKQKNEEIDAVKKNTESVKEMDIQINDILVSTNSIREKLNASYKECLKYYGKDYLLLSSGDKMALGALVNQTKALSAMFDKHVVEERGIDDDN